MKSKLLLCILSSCVTIFLYGQSVGDYRSKQTGNWNSAANWERFDGAAWIAAPAAPTSTDGVITIRTGHTITVNVNITVYQLIVQTSAVLTMIADLTLNNGTGNDLTINGTMNFNTGWLFGPGNMVVANGGILNLGTSQQKLISAPITNNGTMNWSDGTIYFRTTSVLLTNAGTFNITGNNSLQNEGTDAGAAGTLVNSGTITKTSTGITDFQMTAVNNNGTINLNGSGGTLRNQTNPFTNSGNLNFNGGSFLNVINHVFNHNTGSVISGTGSFTNNGRMNLNINQAFPSTMSFALGESSVTTGPGNLTINSNFLMQGEVSGAGSLTVNASITWTGGQLKRALTVGSAYSLTLVPTTDPYNPFLGWKQIFAPIINNGTIVWMDGTIYFESAGVLLTNAGLFHIMGDNSLMNEQGADGIFINSGNTTKSSTGITNFQVSTVTNNNNGIIKGVGTIAMNSTFNSNGTIAPGLSPGILTMNNQQLFSANSTLSIEIAGNGGAGQVTGHDQLQRSGDLTLSGTLTITETGSVPSGDYTIISLTSGAITGTFSATNLPAGYSIVYNSTNVVVRKGQASCLPAVLVTVAPGTTVCAGLPVIFTATPTNGGATPSYQWKLNNNNVGTNSNTYSNNALAHGDQVSVVMTSSAVCANPTIATSNTITMAITPSVTPSVSISASPGSTICAGTNVTFTATPTNGGSPSYQWKLNGNNVGTNSNTYSNNALANSDQVSVLMTSSLACASPTAVPSNPIAITLTATVTPSVSISANPGNIVCQATNVTFTATPTNGGPTPSYQWKLNGNNVGTNSNTYSNHSLNNGHEVSCEMTSSMACASPVNVPSNIIHMTVTGLVTPSVNISSNQGNTICAGTNVTFTATPTHGGDTPSYQWILNNYNVGTNSNTYSNNALANGDWVVCVMRSSLPCIIPTIVSSNIITTTVTTTVTASVNISANPGSTICAGTNVTFTATPTNGGSPSYQWKLNGNNVGTNSNTYSNNTLANSDQVSVEMISSLACAGPTAVTSNPIAITLIPTVTPSVNIAASPGNIVCQTTSVTFTAAPTNGGDTPSYQWKINGTNVGTNSNTYSTHSLATGQEVSCEMTSSLACASPTTATSNTIQMTVTGIVTPSVSISLNQGNTICAGTNVTFTATPTHGGETPSYQWILNNNNVGTNSNTYSNNALANGDWVVCVMRSSLPCIIPTIVSSNIITMTVTATVAPSVSISANPGNTICAGTNVTFTATPTNGGDTPSYQWKLNGNNVGTNSNTYSSNALANGDQVSLLMTSSLACADPVSATSNPMVMSITSGGINAGIVTIGNRHRCPQTLQANPGGDVTYQWYKNGLGILGATERRYVAHSNGSYSVRVTRNGCSNMSSPIDVVSCPTIQPRIYTGTEFIKEELPLIRQNSIRLYPNPASDYVSIELQEDENVNGEATLQLVTLRGQVLLTQKLHVQKGKINCNLKLNSVWRAELYLVKVIVNNKIYVGKLIKIKP